MTDLDIMQDDSEIVHYDQKGIPLYVQTSKLSDYPKKRALCHWHEDIECIRIINGSMNYYINGQRLLLKENDCLIVNARQMHYGYSFNNQECDFICILFHPQLLTSNKVLTQQYLLPFLENQYPEYLYFDSSETASMSLANLLEQITFLKNAADIAYEMEIIGLIHILWGRILQHTQCLPLTPREISPSDLTIQKDMVSYIYLHYTEKLSLSEIAASGNICRNKCCLIFKHYLQQSPIDFLNSYRLKVSCNLLKNTSSSITEIALSCGFHHLSYYSKLFLRSYGCSPSEYRTYN